MNANQVYAIVIASIFCVLLLINSRRWITHIVRFLSIIISKHLIYSYALRRHRYIGPWSRASILVHLVYIAGNIACFSLEINESSLQFSPLSQASLRAGTLSLVNLIPLFAGPHLSTVADLLGLTLDTFRQIHRSAGVMTVLLAILHVLMAVSAQLPFALNLHHNLFAIIGASSLGCIILLSLPIFRNPSYEIFLRVHHALSALSVYAIWQHLSSDSLFPLLYLYILAGIFLFMCVTQCLIFFYRNGFCRSGLTQAHITHVSGAVRLRLQCRKPLAIKAGQYINLWIPGVSFWSFLQSHPFVVISWTEQPQDHLELFIEPRRGITRKLLHHAKNGRSMHSLVLFSGPHGNSIRMDDGENILMVASDFGIAAQLPYLKQLIHGYNTRKLRAQRIHLVWQVRDIDVTIAVQPLLNGALSEDTLDDGWILDISIYCESRDTTVSFGKRASVYPGKAPIHDIIQEEISKRQMETKPVKEMDWNTESLVYEKELESRRSDGKMIVTVSGTAEVRDELRSAIRDKLADDVKYFELDYQPV